MTLRKKRMGHYPYHILSFTGSVQRASELQKVLVAPKHSAYFTKGEWLWNMAKRQKESKKRWWWVKCMFHLIRERNKVHTMVILTLKAHKKQGGLCKDSNACYKLWFELVLKLKPFDNMKLRIWRTYQHPCKHDDGQSTILTQLRKVIWG